MSEREPGDEDPAATERRTSELCGDRDPLGNVCMRRKHHDGVHECYRATATPVRWK